MKKSLHRGSRLKAAFSLVELMIVVGIIGILATLAVPRYKNFTAKAKQTEAKTNIKQIFTLAETWQSQHGQYMQHLNIAIVADPDCVLPELKTLGFNIPDCSVARYDYYYWDLGPTDFEGAAVGDPAVIYPGCTTTLYDVWSIQSDKSVDHMIEKWAQLHVDVTEVCN